MELAGVFEADSINDKHTFSTFADGVYIALTCHV